MIDKKAIPELIKNFSEIIKTDSFEQDDDNYRLYAFDYCWNSSYSSLYANENEKRIYYEITKKSSKQTKEPWQIIKVEFGLDGETTTIPIPPLDEIEQVEVCKVKNLSHTYLWESEFDCSKNEPIDYKVPSIELVSFFGLKQKDSGIWTNLKNEIVVMDLSLIKKSNLKGLYILKDEVMKKINTNKTFIWHVRFELQTPQKNEDQKNYYSSDLLFGLDEKGNVVQLASNSE